MSLMPSCKDITEHASDYLEHHLSLRQRLGYRLHLFMCVNCRRYLDQLQLTIRTIGKTPQASPPPVAPQQVQEIVERLRQQAGE